MKLFVEATKSRTGLHAARSVVVIVGRGEARIIDKPTARSRGTYSRGLAGEVDVEANPGDHVVWVWLARNPRGRVTGRVRVYSWKGDLLLEAVIRKRKVRRSRGDPSLGWVVETALSALGLSSYIRRYNWATGGG